MDASPKAIPVIRLSEQVIHADTVWMLVTERRLRPHVRVPKVIPGKLQSKPKPRDLEAYFEFAGLPPVYVVDPLAAEQYYDLSAAWFLSAYSVALAQMDQLYLLPDSTLRVIERLRRRASGAVRARQAACA